MAIDSFRISSGGGGGLVGAFRTYIAPEVVLEDYTQEIPKRTEVEIQPTEQIKEITISKTRKTSFTRSLEVGDKGEDVRSLQRFLNAQGFTVSNTGAGSAGQETTYFGPATKAALKNYQEAHKEEILTPLGLEAGTGYLGEATIQKIAEQSPQDGTDTTEPIKEQAEIIRQTQIRTIKMLIDELIKKVNQIRKQKTESDGKGISLYLDSTTENNIENPLSERTIFYINDEGL